MMHYKLPTALVLLALLIAVSAGCAPARVQEVDHGPATQPDRSFGDMVSDQRLRSRIVGEILNDDELLEQSNINVTVFNRIVLLTGEVNRPDAGRRIAAFARRQSDARHVYNELMVAELSSVIARGRDGLIATNARTRILQLKEPPSLNSERVRVIAERRRLYLMGRVTRAEADAITETVRRVGGVREVVKLFEYLD
ncbi:MAG: BON domain-containing protein [Aquisalimonadaceae bacterium]